MGLVDLGQPGVFLLDGDVVSSSGHSESGRDMLWKSSPFYSNCRVGWILSLCPGLRGEHKNHEKHSKISCLGWAGSSSAAQAAPRNLDAVQDFACSFATSSSEDFLKVGGFKVWSLGQSGQFFLWMTKKHSWNKGESPPDKLPRMGLVRASLLAGYYPDFIFFQHRHNSAFFPDPDYWTAWNVLVQRFSKKHSSCGM